MRVSPTRFSAASSLLALAVLSSVTPYLTTASQYTGVYFAADRPVLISDLYWMVVSDVQFETADKLVRDLKRWLNDKEGMSLNETIRNNFKVTYDPDPLQNLLWERAQGWALNSRKELDVICDRMLITKQTISNSTRKKKGLLNVGGDLLKWAFGTPSSSDLVEVNE